MIQYTNILLKQFTMVKEYEMHFEMLITFITLKRWMISIESIMSLGYEIKYGCQYGGYTVFLYALKYGHSYGMISIWACM